MAGFLQVLDELCFRGQTCCRALQSANDIVASCSPQSSNVHTIPRRLTMYWMHPPRQTKTKPKHNSYTFEDGQTNKTQSNQDINRCLRCSTANHPHMCYKSCGMTVASCARGLEVNSQNRLLILLKSANNLGDSENR
eukprot:3651847-Amphidinium_carterae.1